jgi:diketogulonate reductase-like aldo/keto reductase
MFSLKGFGTYKIKDKSIIELAIKNGYNFLDTAELYKNESIISEVINNSILISTKISYKSIMTNKIEESFYARLNIFKKLFIILLHHPSDDCKRDWDILSELYLKNRDKVMHIGVSNYRIKHLKQIENCKIKPFCNQFELNPFCNQKEIIDYCKNNEIIIVSHTTLTQGSRLNDCVLIKLSTKYNVSAARLLLKWAKQNGFIVIPKASTDEHMKENLDLDFMISDQDMNSLNNMNEDHHLIKLLN